MVKQDEEISRFPRFQGGFHTWRQTIFIDQENRIKDVFLVFSSGKREAVQKLLWHKLVWDQLSKIEFELFIFLLKDSDYIYWSFLKLLAFIPKKILRKNLNVAEKRLNLPITSRESYIGLLRIRIEIRKETRSLPKTKKFSGYIKSLASRGKSQLGVSRIELETSASPDFVNETDQYIVWEALLSDRR